MKSTSSPRTRPSKEPENKYAGMSLFEEDLAALRELRRRLREEGLAVSMRYLVRALAHLTAEPEIFAHALVRHKAEAAGKVGHGGAVVRNVGFNFLTEDLDKLDRVTLDLEDKGAKGGRTFLMRSLIHAPWNPSALARDIRKFQKEFPDARTREGRARRQRG